MGETVKYTLDESKLPDAWYNLAADLPEPPPPPCIPARASRSAPTISRRSSRWR